MRIFEILPELYGAVLPDLSLWDYTSTYLRKSTVINELTIVFEFGVDCQNNEIHYYWIISDTLLTD